MPADRNNDDLGHLLGNLLGNLQNTALQHDTDRANLVFEYIYRNQVRLLQ